ncbi:MAG TPA: ATPase [Porphyromonadaceae bacterium]|nr:ATPase [Porphyromonadaceae bacterium]
MYRTAINKLKEWKFDSNKKPLIFLRARQVGKTWLIKEFGKTEYRQMVYVNFDDRDAPRDIFLQNFDTKRLISELEFYSDIQITAEDTLIVFDEIQSAPRGITSLKYFCENARQYQIVAAGSLLGVKIHPDESFPVGKVNTLELFPMSFYEFLLATGATGLARILEEKQWDISVSFAEKFKEYLRYYFYVGGMPEAVSFFAQNREWKKAREIQIEILKNYQNDFSKHAPAAFLPRINMIWENIPAQLAKENKKFIYSVMRKGARAKDFETAIQWLTDSGLLHKVYNISKPALPLTAYRELSNFKLYHNDVGLLAAMSGLNAKTLIEGHAVFTEFKGALAEQFAYQQLRINKNLNINYFTFDNSKYEIDFILQNEEDEIIPVEVKSGENLKARSFRLFCENFNPAKAIKSSFSNYKQESWMTNVPLYLLGDYFS